MQEITLKLHKKFMDEFSPIAENMAEKGFQKDDIVKVFVAQLKLKAKQYYQKQHGMKPVGDLFNIDELKKLADSKAESIFYDMLINSGIKFKFQYAIGPYRADYLVAGNMVVEIDGPQHKEEHDEKRDIYMRKMGYKILRVPTWILVSCPEAVMSEINEAIAGMGVKK